MVANVFKKLEEYDELMLYWHEKKTGQRNDDPYRLDWLYDESEDSSTSGDSFTTSAGTRIVRGKDLRKRIELGGRYVEYFSSFY